MKLHSAPFEKAVRARVKAAIRSSPELKREARRAAKSRSSIKTAPFLRVIFAGAIGCFTAAISKNTGHPATALAALAAWAFFAISFRAQNLLTCLYQAVDIPALILLPTPETTIFRWEFQKFCRASILSLIDLTAGFIGVAAMTDSGTAFIAALPAALLMWLTLLASTLLCASLFPRIPYALIASFGIVSGMILYWTRVFAGSFVVGLFDHYSASILVLLPTGWSASLFLLLLGKFDWATLLLLVPMGALISTMPASLARLRRKYHFKEPVRAEAPDLVPPVSNAHEDEELEIEEPRPFRVGSDAIEEIGRTRLFSLSPEWRGRGWFESKLWNWLTSREKAVAEFTFPRGIVIGAAWKKIFRNLAITCLLTLGISLLNSSAEFWVLAIGIFVTICQVISRIHFSGVAFQLRTSGGINQPLYSAYPVGFRELSGLLLKYSAIQIPLLLLYALPAGAFCSWVLKAPLVWGMAVTIKGTGMLVALRFISLTLNFSSGTNDSSRLSLRSFVIVIAVVGCGLVFLGLGAAGFLVENPKIAWILWAMALVNAYLFFALYQWFYNRGWFDLMNVPRR